MPSPHKRLLTKRRRRAGVLLYALLGSLGLHLAIMTVIAMVNHAPQIPKEKLIEIDLQQLPKSPTKPSATPQSKPKVEKTLPIQQPRESSRPIPKIKRRPIPQKYPVKKTKPTVTPKPKAVPPPKPTPPTMPDATKLPGNLQTHRKSEKTKIPGTVPDIFTHNKETQTRKMGLAPRQASDATLPHRDE